jgi:hypothetical protein
MFIYDCDVEVNNNTVAYNRLTSEYSNGGGIYSNDNGSYTGVNNIIYFNEAAYNPQCAGNPNLTYTCCSTSLAGIGNITDDPGFVDPDNKNYHLLAGSPCIDTGDPDWPLDPDSTRADMGALYYHQALAIGDPLLSTLPKETQLLSPYPNPFNASTMISYQLSEVSHVNLAVYDVAGHKVAELVDGWREAGSHEVTFDESDLPSGVYFAFFNAGVFEQTQKLLLVK